MEYANIDQKTVTSCEGPIEITDRKTRKNKLKHFWKTREKVYGKTVAELSEQHYNGQGLKNLGRNLENSFSNLGKSAATQKKNYRNIQTNIF